jgi:hypothetical protein
VVHDFSYTPAAVPEPAGWPLLAIAAAAVGTIRGFKQIRAERLLLICQAFE